MSQTSVAGVTALPTPEYLHKYIKTKGVIWHFLRSLLNLFDGSVKYSLELEIQGTEARFSLEGLAVVWQLTRHRY